MKSFRMMMKPDRYDKGYWGNLAIRKDEKFYIQLQWDDTTRKGVLEFRAEDTHNILGHMPFAIDVVVGEDNEVLFKREKA